MPRARRILPASPAFTLIEAVLAMLIVGVALVPAIGMLGATAVDRQSHSDLARGMALAKGLMGEIVQCKYNDPTGSPGASRSTWTQLQDYNGLLDSPPTNRDGSAIPGYTGWSRAVRVGFATPATPDSASGSDKGLQGITVTVTSPAGKVYTLSALRSSLGMADRAPSTSSTYPNSVTITIQGTGGEPSSAGVNLPNQVP